MAGVNKVILVGNLGSKPELKYTPAGVAVCKFSIATSENWGKTETGERKEHTEWHRITAWRKLAEICGQYLDKGSKVYIEGKIRTNSWVDKDNVKKYSTEIQADQMGMLSPKGMRENVPDAPRDSGSYPGENPEKSAGQQTQAAGGGSGLGETLDLDEDVDFF